MHTNFESVRLHPAMTAEQIAAWCHRHRKVVTIEWHATPEGKVTPIMTAIDDSADDAVPMFLRRQAE